MHVQQRPPRTDQLSALLDHDWAALRRRPAVLARARAWGLTERPIGDLDDLLAATGYRCAPTPERNAVLRALLDVARTDDLAARIVLQRILPGLLAVVRRRARFHHGSGGLLEELVGAAWITIRVAYVAPGSRHVAATLVSDARHRAFVAPARKRSAGEVARDPSAFVESPGHDEPSALEELAELVREARRRGLPAEDVELVRDLVRAESTAAVAAARSVTPRTVRNHRARAVYGIRRLAAA